jgi:hypothetical protein
MFPELSAHACCSEAPLPVQYLSVFTDLLPKDRTFPVQVLTPSANFGVWIVLHSHAADTLCHKGKKEGFHMDTVMACRPAKYLLKRLNAFRVTHEMSNTDISGRDLGTLY